MQGGGGEGSVAIEVQAKEHLLDMSRPYSPRAKLNDDTPATLSIAASAEVDLNAAHPSMLCDAQFGPRCKGILQRTRASADSASRLGV